MADQKIELSTTKLITGVATALIVGAIFGGFGVIRLADSNAIVLAGHTASIQAIEEKLVPRSEYEIRFQSTTDRLDRIENKIDQLLSR